MDDTSTVSTIWGSITTGLSDAIDTGAASYFDQLINPATTSPVAPASVKPASGSVSIPALLVGIALIALLFKLAK